MTATTSKGQTEVVKLATTAAEEATQNFVGSAMFMKMLTSVALYGVVYHRKLLPEDSFDVFHIMGHAFPYIKDSSGCPDANLFYKLTSSIRDALDDQYLSEIMLNIYEDKDNPQSLIESYTYKYEYKDEERAQGTNREHNKRHDSDFVKQKLLRLMDLTKLRCSQMKPLPESWDMVLYLRYTENAPEDYNSHGFDPCSSLPDVEKEIKISLGRITTPFHQLKVHNHSDVVLDDCGEVFVSQGQDSQRNNVESNDEGQQAAPKQAAPEPAAPEEAALEETAQELFDSGPLFKNANKTVKAPNKKGKNTKGRKNASKKINHLEFMDFEGGEDGGSQQFCCPCQRNFTSSTFTTLKCHWCKKDQHAECYGLVGSSIDENFIHTCDGCAEENDELVCSDPELPNKYPPEKKMSCQLRTTLASFNYYREIDVSLLMAVQHVPKRIAKSLLDHSIKLGVFQVRNKYNPDTWIVNYPALEKILPKFFRSAVPNNAMPAEQLEGLALEDPEEIMCTPNVVTNADIEFSQSRIRNLEKNLLDISMDSLASKQSVRIRNKMKREHEDGPSSNNTRGGSKLFKRYR